MRITCNKRNEILGEQRKYGEEKFKDYFDLAPDVTEYTNSLIEAVKDHLLDIVDDAAWETDDDAIYLHVFLNDEAHDINVPLSDLTGDVEKDSEYVLDYIRGLSDHAELAEIGASIMSATNWTEAYEEFEDIAETYAGDEAEIRLRVNELHSEHAGDDAWEEAYRRWNDSAYETDLDDEEKHELEQKVSEFLFDELNEHFEHGLLDRLEKAVPEYRDEVNVRATRERWDELEEKIKYRKQEYVRALLQSLMEDKI